MYYFVQIEIAQPAAAKCQGVQEFVIANHKYVLCCVIEIFLSQNWNTPIWEAAEKKLNVFPKTAFVTTFVPKHPYLAKQYIWYMAKTGGNHSLEASWGG